MPISLNTPEAQQDVTHYKIASITFDVISDKATVVALGGYLDGGGEFQSLGVIKEASMEGAPLAALISGFYADAKAASYSILGLDGTVI